MADGILKVGTITTSSGSGTITLGQSGETVDMANGSITLNSDMKSTPAFSAYINAASFQFAENSWTKLQMYGEDFDTDGAYDTSNARFTIPAGAAGKYNFNIQLRSINNHTIRFLIGLYKNGSKQSTAETRVAFGSGTTFPCVSLTDRVDAAVGDYFEAYAYHTNTGGDNGVKGASSSTATRETWWSANRIIGA